MTVQKKHIQIFLKHLLLLFLVISSSHSQNQKVSLYLEEGKSGTVWDIVLTKDGSKLYSCGRDSTAKVWNTQTGEAIRTIRLSDATLNTCLALSPDENFFLVGDMKNKINLWDAQSGVLVKTISGGEGYIVDLEVFPDGKTFAASRRDGTITFYDYDTNVLKVIDAQSMWVTAIAVSHDGKFIASSGQDGSIKIWNIETGNLKTHLGNHSRYARAVCFSNDDAFLFSGGKDGLIKVWDVATNALVRTMKITDGFPHHLSMSFDGNTLIVSSMNYLLETWDWKRCLMLREYDARSYSAMTALMNKDGTRLYSAHIDGSVKIWNPAHGTLLAQMVGFSDGQWITFTQDGYFDCSAQGSRYASWKQGEDLFPFELYDELFHKSSIIEDALLGRYTSQSSLSSVIEPPSAKIISPRDKQLFSFGTEPLQVLVEVESSDKTKVESEEILVNGRLLGEGQILEKKILLDSLMKRKVQFKVQVLPGQNVIEAVCYNSSRIRSDPSRVTIDVETEQTLQPSLFVFTVGMDKYSPAFPDLQFASVDALKFAEALRLQEGKLFTRVYTTSLVNKEATRENILKAIERFPKMTPNDMLVFFFSGHGVRARNAKGDTKYFYASAGTTPENILQRGLSWDDFTAQLSKVNVGRILLFLDACHSGDISNGASNEKVAASIARQMGIVFASSSGSEYSFENSEWGHGAFTKAILDAFSGGGDYTKDDKVDWSELQLFVISKVRELTKGSQNPMIPRLEQFTNFDLVRLK